ncbi:hypothetical protein [Acinetobacter sp.]|uniref:hypothetical protein n=1 Tax=Acinetobacter sp. TaxID=472 RepID=UPI00388D3DA8
MAALTKAAKYGWKAMKIVYSKDPEVQTCAVALSTTECCAWMLPDGTIQRAKVGAKTVYLDKKWTESV